MEEDSEVRKERQNQEFMEFYGRTREEQRMTETINANAGAVFAERYGVHIPGKPTIETKITDTIGGIFRAKEFGFFRGREAGRPYEAPDPGAEAPPERAVDVPGPLQGYQKAPFGNSER